jgi:hypothetical protein
MKRPLSCLALLACVAGTAFAADNATSYGEKVQQADGSGPAANAEASVQRGAKKAGHAVKQGVKKTGQAVGKGLQKTGEAVDRAGEKLEHKSQ